jgi:3-deoxy-manno-octulosonate cytidylyltransferase (CMP-KDO synthetase)
MIAGIIPARMGSKRFPGKPLTPILGKPMIQWVWERAAWCSSLDYLYITTPDPEIIEVANDFGARTLLTGKCTSGTERVLDAACKLCLSPDDYVINIQGDEPLVTPDMLDRLIAGVMRPCSVATLFYRSDAWANFHNHNVVKLVNDSYYQVLYFSREGIPSLPIGRVGRYSKHIGLYAYKVQELKRWTWMPAGRLEKLENLEQLRWLEHGLSVVAVESETDTISVDVPEDVTKVERLLI